MKITIYQQDIKWASPQQNRENLDSILESLPEGTDLLVLPEMFSTGFATEPEGIAEPSVNGSFPTLEWMKERSSQCGFAIAGSVAVEEEGTYFNRFCFVKPNGECSFYNKHHLFAYGNEHKRYSAGTERLIVEYKGVRFIPLICYDLRFPVWSRNRGDYDAMIYVASWPTSRVEAWRTLLKARAIENQSYLIGVNRVGEDPSCTYCGGSAIIDPYGKPLAECADGKAEMVSAELDMELLNNFREKFPVLGDADRI